MAEKQNLLVIQSFVVTEPGTYWDYRDYIFCLCSNPSIKSSSFRFNLEKGQEFAEEFRQAVKAHGFSNFVLTTETPKNWADYMLGQIEANQAEWVMPWPGDHIYVNPDKQAFLKALRKGEELGADAVLYGHMQDFEYFLDWDRINVLYNDLDYVMIEWGRRNRFRQNKKLQSLGRELMKRSLYMIPVPAFAVYKRQFFKEILQALPKNTKRWQDMENSQSKSAWNFKLLMPKQCLYRHVHGYWLEGFFKYYGKGYFPKNEKEELYSWYVRTNYNWKTNSPSPSEYRQMCLKAWPYFKKYFGYRKSGQYANEFGSSPFDPNWKSPSNILTRVGVVIQNFILEPAKLFVAELLKSAKK